jgi:hypothetical protein
MMEGVFRVYVLGGILVRQERAMPYLEEGNYITYELLSLVIERSSNIVSLFKELENIRINA